MARLQDRSDSSEEIELAGSLETLFERLSKKYRSTLLTVIEARLDAQMAQRLDASDVVQETLLEVFQRLEDFRERRPMPLVAWLRRTAIQQLKLAQRRHRKVQARSVSRQVSYEQSSIYRLAEQLTAVELTAADRYQERESDEQVRRALDQLKVVDREILLLRYVNELSNIDAAITLGVSETVASKRHCRALIRLQSVLTNVDPSR